MKTTKERDMAPEETKWVEIPSEDINDVLDTEKGGIHFTVRMSPHDIPEAVRGRYDKKLGRLVVEFRYIEDEPWYIPDKSGPVAVRVGKNSERLLGIEIDVDRLEAKVVGIRIQPEDMANEVSGAIDRVARRLHSVSESRKRNYKVAQEVLKDKNREIFRPIPVCAS